MTEKTINTTKLFENIYNKIFILDLPVEKEKFIEFLKKEVERKDEIVEEQIVELVKYCVLAHDRIVKQFEENKGNVLPN